ncbi:hypothetical protein DERF_001551 [Dermatophagoides farinae]|uniref:Uncharacterized protein n=1 Tax=Dermatophagoides farinae TaxID=6954 RepID=A0A922I8U7_DERFA|nr:hypothetical protein DERF_001551 [Dermatophagoides farinae]
MNLGLCRQVSKRNSSKGSVYSFKINIFGFNFRNFNFILCCLCVYTECQSFEPDLFVQNSDQ